MPDVWIIGGGVSGLICAYVFRETYGVDVCVLEPRALGGEFASGGLKYIHQTDLMEETLQDLDVLYSTYNVCGGILLHGVVEPYPQAIQAMDAARRDRIQYDHYRKTRKIDPDKFGERSMNDPAATGSRRALKCDPQELVAALARNCNVVPAQLRSFTDSALYTSSGRFEYKHLVTTLPLWVINRLAYFELPLGVAMRLNVVNVAPKDDPYARWDYVYTPYTPGDAIHRFSPVQDGYACETNGEFDELAVHSDLNFIFPSGWVLTGQKLGLNGHLCRCLKNLVGQGTFVRLDVSRNGTRGRRSMWFFKRAIK